MTHGPGAHWICPGLLALIFLITTGASLAAPRISERFSFRHEIADIIHPLPKQRPLSERPDSRLVTLGQRLFNDPRLSRDGDFACSTCHNLSQGGADGKPQSRRNGLMNTQSIFNVRYLDRLYWNGRARSLEEQADMAISNPGEMASSWPTVLQLIRQDERYRIAFRQVLDTDSIDKNQVITALVTYERTLVTRDARLDLYLQGNLTALNADELEGLRRFRDYGCVACHQGLNIGTNLFQTLGIVKPYLHDDDLSPEHDRYEITGRLSDRKRFRVPSLRNVDLTAPYLHDGSIPGLRGVVNAMFRYQLGLVPSQNDIELILKFLKTLTGRSPADMGKVGSD